MHSVADNSWLKNAKGNRPLSLLQNSSNKSLNIADLAYQSMVGFVSAKNSILRITRESKPSNTTYEYVYLPCTVAPSKATILKCTSTHLLLCYTYLSTSYIVSLQAYIPSVVPWCYNSCTNVDKAKLCYAPESTGAEIGPSELAIKCRGKSKKGVYVCLITLDRVALPVVLHVLSYCVAVSAHAASHMVGCCTGVAAARTVLYVVGYNMTVTVLTMSCTRLGMLSQFGCCI